MPLSRPTNSMLQLVKNLFSRFTQSPNVYPIKFYKKSDRSKRHRQMYMVK